MPAKLNLTSSWLKNSIVLAGRLNWSRNKFNFSSLTRSLSKSHGKWQQQQQQQQKAYQRLNNKLSLPMFGWTYIRLIVCLCYNICIKHTIHAPHTLQFTYALVLNWYMKTPSQSDRIAQELFKEQFCCNWMCCFGDATTAKRTRRHSIFYEEYNYLTMRTCNFSPCCVWTHN